MYRHIQKKKNCIKIKQILLKTIHSSLRLEPEKVGGWIFLLTVCALKISLYVIDPRKKKQTQQFKLNILITRTLAKYFDNR